MLNTKGTPFVTILTKEIKNAARFLLLFTTSDPILLTKIYNNTVMFTAMDTTPVPIIMCFIVHSSNVYSNVYYFTSFTII